ncbi:MAG: hypothetical protein ABI459_10220 [Deltaproteobacteria bacterium]
MIRAGIFVIAAAATLSACVEQTAAPATKPAAMASTGLDPLTGIDRSALAAVIGLGKQVSVIYDPKKIDPAQKAAAPALACKKRGSGIESVVDKLPEHPESLPGLRHLVIYCK